jgi:uncharacterized membrane protein
MFSGVLAGEALSRLLNNKPKLPKILISALVVLCTIPTTIITLKDVYIPKNPPAKISNEELDALNFLSKQDEGIVLTLPFDESLAKLAEPNPPRPLYLYASTAYVSAFSNHQTFLEDEINLTITNFDWKKRRDEIISNFVNAKAAADVSNFLKENKIRYVYLTNQQARKFPPKIQKLTKIFENTEVTIYQVP